MAGGFFAISAIRSYEERREFGAHDTGAFVSNASQSDMYEIQAGQLAETRSKNKDIKAFAKMMVADHTATSKALAEMKQVAEHLPFRRAEVAGDRPRVFRIVDRFLDLMAKGRLGFIAEDQMAHSAP